MANKAADWAFKENHKMLRTSCPRIEIREGFTTQTVLFSYFSLRKNQQYIYPDMLSA